jgi:hypothetical protein
MVEITLMGRDECVELLAPSVGSPSHLGFRKSVLAPVSEHGRGHVCIPRRLLGGEPVLVEVGRLREPVDGSAADGKEGTGSPL